MPAVHSIHLHSCPRSCETPSIPVSSYDTVFSISLKLLHLGILCSEQKIREAVALAWEYIPCGVKSMKRKLPFFLWTNTLKLAVSTTALWEITIMGMNVCLNTNICVRGCFLGNPNCDNWMVQVPPAGKGRARIYVSLPDITRAFLLCAGHRIYQCKQWLRGHCVITIQFTMFALSIEIQSFLSLSQRGTSLKFKKK